MSLLLPTRRPLLSTKKYRGQYLNALAELDFINKFYRVGNSRNPDFERIAGVSYTGGAGFLTGETLDGDIEGPVAANDPSITDMGLAVWETRTNICLYSADASLGLGNNSGSTVTQNATYAPDGTLTADRVQLAAGGKYHYKRSPAAYGTYIMSMWVKADAPANIIIRAANTAGDQNATKSVALTTQWQRVQLTYTWSSGTFLEFGVDTRIAVAGGDDAAKDFYVWGTQIELGSSISPYIPTTSTVATRTAIVPVITGLDSILTAPFTAFVEAYLPVQDGADRRLLSLSDGSNNNRIVVQRSTSNTIGAFVITNNITQGGIGNAAWAAQGARVIRAAVRVRSTSWAFAANGVVGEATGITPPTGINRIDIGASSGGASAMVNGHVRRVLILPDTSDAEMQALTSFNSMLDLDYTQ